MPKIARLLVAFAVLCGGVLTGNASEQGAYVIGVNDAYSEPQSRAIIKRLSGDIYAPLGIPPDLRFYPSSRGMQSAGRLETDAEARTVLIVAEQYENLIVLPAVMLSHDIYLFCVDANRCERSHDNLFAIIGGFQVDKTYCENFELECFFDQSVSFLSTALSNGTADVLVGSQPTLLNLFCQNDAKRLSMRQESAMEVFSYHLVYLRHVDRVEVLEASIERMHRDGNFAEFKRYITQLPSNCDIETIELK